MHESSGMKEDDDDRRLMTLNKEKKPGLKKSYK